MSNHIAQRAGGAVDAARREAGVTKTWLAQRTGIPYPSLVRKIAGRTEFVLSELFLIAEALGVTPASLIAGLGRPVDRLAA